MGEFADMVLNGLVCSSCAEYMDDYEEPGFPRYCSTQCAVDARAVNIDEVMDEAMDEISKKDIQLQELKEKLQSQIIEDAEFDVFLMHASEDKSGIAREFFDELIKRDISVWFDESQISMGDSIIDRIESGIKRSLFGLAVITPNFLKKEWTRREYKSFLTREISSGNKAILPVWHNVSLSSVQDYSPFLADKRAESTAELTVEQICDKIKRVLS